MCVCVWGGGGGVGGLGGEEDVCVCGGGGVGGLGGGRTDKILVTLTVFSRSNRHFELKFDTKMLVCTLLYPKVGISPN